MRGEEGKGDSLDSRYEILEEIGRVEFSTGFDEQVELVHNEVKHGDHPWA